MTRFDVSSVGFAVLDILGRPVTRIPEGGRADFIEEIRMTVAGTAAATAVDCAILGLRTRMVSTVGQDEMGDFLVSKMQQYGLDTDLVRRDSSVQTSATILPVRPNGERPALHVPGTAATFKVEPEDLEGALDAKISVSFRRLLIRASPSESVSRLSRSASYAVTMAGNSAMRDEVV